MLQLNQLKDCFTILLNIKSQSIFVFAALATVYRGGGSFRATQRALHLRLLHVGAACSPYARI